jgi:hypothetical protein
MKLRDDQLWFARAVVASEDAGEASHRLTPGPKLDASDRLDIYRRGYRARLLECLADDYPVLEHALGADAFEALCDEYVTRFPSQSPSLNAFGRHMPGFCQGFAADLAALEWAIVEAIHAPSAVPLAAAELAAIPGEMWPRMRLQKAPSLQVVRAAHPANEYFQAVRDGGNPVRPGPSPSATAVYRKDLTVWRQRLTPVMADVLAAVVRGETLEEAVAPVPDDQPPERVLAWFREWTEAGLFVSVVAGSS